MACARSTCRRRPCRHCRRWTRRSASCWRREARNLEEYAMNGKKSVLSSAFRQALHIPSVKRGPTREKVNTLQATLRRLPPGSEVQALLAELDKAKRLVFDKLPVNDDASRQSAVTQAETICTRLNSEVQR